MYLHLDTLLAGIITILCFAWIAPDWRWGAAVAAICMLMDSGKWYDMRGRGRDRTFFAIVTLIQAIALGLAFVGVWQLVHRR